MVTANDTIVPMGYHGQHRMLHQRYGVANCCLCHAEMRIKQLEYELKKLQEVDND